MVFGKLQHRQIRAGALVENISNELNFVKVTSVLSQLFFNK